MPRRQRFKPSRKPKPAIEPIEQDQLIGHAADERRPEEPTIEQPPDLVDRAMG